MHNLTAALVAAAVLSFAPAALAQPRALPGATSGLHLPRVNGMPGVLAFMERAGQRSVMLRGSTWFGDVHPLFPVDFSQPQGLSEYGVSADAAATVSSHAGGRMTCHGVADVKRFDERARARLELLGKGWEGKVAGLSAVGAAREDGSLAAGVVRRGNVACVVSSRKDARPLLTDAAKATGKPQPKDAWAKLGGLKGEVFLITGDAAMGVTGEADALRVDGRARGLAVPALVSNTTSPYATLAPDALAVMRANVRPSELPRAVRSLIQPLGRACSGCPREHLATIEKTLPAALTGKMAVVLHTAHVKGRLRTEADSFFAARHVWLAEVKDRDTAVKALAGLEHMPGAKLEGEVWTVPLDASRSVQVGLHAAHLYLSNDPAALQAALAALPQKASKMERGLEASLDPAKAHRTLSQVSLVDVLGAKGLAGLLAVSTEFGPVLQVSSGISGWAASEAGGAHRFGALLTLRPPE